MRKHKAIEIIDITHKRKYERLLIRCIFHVRKERPIKEVYRRNRERVAYLKSAIPKGYCMKVLFHQDNYVGMIEYGPPEAAALPIKGRNIIVMNCIWVHAKVKGNGFGQLLMKDMIRSQQQASGFATIGLENYWMMWLQKKDMEKLGFQSVRSVTLKHKTYKRNQRFSIHLMWLPNKKDSDPPQWDESQLLYGVDFCNSHPLYWGRYGCGKSGLRQIYERAEI
jgi:ribosomal protein S18 acetylase RimI-like enzyme